MMINMRTVAQTTWTKLKGLLLCHWDKGRVGTRPINLQGLVSLKYKIFLEKIIIHFKQDGDM